MGCPIRGVILDPIVAMQMGIQGQVFFQGLFIFPLNPSLQCTIICVLNMIEYFSFIILC